MIDLNQFADEIHAHNVAVGWWDNDPSLEEKFQMVSTEICEATEGERKDLMDDHLPHRKMGEVELADTLIRVLDIGRRKGLTYTPGSVYLARDSAVQYHWYLTCTLGEFYHYTGEDEYSELVGAIIAVGRELGYDVIGAAKEKFEYNKTRKDHTRESRAKTGGKKF